MNGDKEQGLETLRSVYKEHVNQLGGRLNNPYPEYNYAEHMWKKAQQQVEIHTWNCN